MINAFGREQGEQPGVLYDANAVSMLDVLDLRALSVVQLQC